jgi:hypothetical protein
MNNNDILANLRKRMVEAVQIGMVNQDAGGVLETVLIQIVNEAERNKQRCDQLSYDYKRQAAQAEAQANAYTQIQSIVYAVLNGFVNAAAAAVEQEKQREQTKEELSAEEIDALAALAAQQEEEKEKEAIKRRRR